MAAEKKGIDKGMKVYSFDGEELGTISHIWTDVGETPTLPQDYFVASEEGFLGIGGKDLYIPFEAVLGVVPHEAVTVNGNKEQCVDLYSAKPEGIKKREAVITEAAVIAATNTVIFH